VFPVKLIDVKEVRILCYTETFGTVRFFEEHDKVQLHPYEK
jgi:hypothetical protein